MLQVNLFISEIELKKTTDFMDRWNKKYPECKFDSIEDAARWVFQIGLRFKECDSPELY